MSLELVGLEKSNKINATEETVHWNSRLTWIYMQVRHILSSVCLRWSLFSPSSFLGYIYGAGCYLLQLKKNLIPSARVIVTQFCWLIVTSFRRIWSKYHQCLLSKWIQNVVGKMWAILFSSQEALPVALKFINYLSLMWAHVDVKGKRWIVSG